MSEYQSCLDLDEKWATMFAASVENIRYMFRWMLLFMQGRNSYPQSSHIYSESDIGSAISAVCIEFVRRRRGLVCIGDGEQFVVLASLNTMTKNYTDKVMTLIGICEVVMPISNTFCGKTDLSRLRVVRRELVCKISILMINFTILFISLLTQSFGLKVLYANQKDEAFEPILIAIYFFCLLLFAASKVCAIKIRSAPVPGNHSNTATLDSGNEADSRLPGKELMSIVDWMPTSTTWGWESAGRKTPLPPNRATSHYIHFVKVTFLTGRLETRPVTVTLSERSKHNKLEIEKINKTYKKNCVSFKTYSVLFIFLFDGGTQEARKGVRMRGQGLTRAVHQVCPLILLSSLHCLADKSRITYWLALYKSQKLASLGYHFGLVLLVPDELGDNLVLHCNVTSLEAYFQSVVALEIWKMISRGNSARGSKMMVGGLQFTLMVDPSTGFDLLPPQGVTFLFRAPGPSGKVSKVGFDLSILVCKQHYGLKDRGENIYKINKNLTHYKSKHTRFTSGDFGVLNIPIKTT
uniref:Uncharacterized protein n=1 Tax=Strigamia maritima TaxID=126957 RepID=T1IWD1_STRMM